MPSSNPSPKPRVSQGSSTSAPKPNRMPLTQLPLSVRREQLQREREKQQEPQQHPSETEGRRNLDKRTARLRYADEFKHTIDKHKRSQSTTTTPTPRDEPHPSPPNEISVFIRKRPLFSHERRRGDYDIISAISSVPDPRMTIYNCVMHSDMKTKFVKPISYPCTHAFDEHCTTDDVYHLIAPIVKSCVINGGVGTVLLYGPTGSGKTYTMTGLEERIAEGVWSFARGEYGTASLRVERDDYVDAEACLPIVTVRFVELTGKVGRDLLGETKKKTNCDEIRIVDGEDGSVKLLQAETVRVTCPKELLDVIASGKRNRATEATDTNGVSSRSHAVCQIEIRSPPTTKSKIRGLLTLIDCAGSERRHDSLYHTKERQKESAEINASLWSLKECIRARTINATSDADNEAHVPYRSNPLTRILRESFERQDAKLCVIATVSPNATDAEHSMDTLKTAATIAGWDQRIEEGSSIEVVTDKSKATDVPPKRWDHQRLVRFFRKKNLSFDVSPDVDGKTIMKMSVAQLRLRIFDGNEDAAARAFRLLRSESDRVAKIQLKERNELKMLRKGM